MHPCSCTPTTDLGASGEPTADCGTYIRDLDGTQAHLSWHACCGTRMVCSACPDKKEKAQRIVQVWTDRALFATAFIAKIQKIFSTYLQRNACSGRLSYDTAALHARPLVSLSTCLKCAPFVSCVPLQKLKLDHRRSPKIGTQATGGSASR